MKGCKFCGELNLDADGMFKDTVALKEFGDTTDEKKPCEATLDISEDGTCGLYFYSKDKIYVQFLFTEKITHCPFCGDKLPKAK